MVADAVKKRDKLKETQTIISFVLPIFEILNWDFKDYKSIKFEDSDITNKRADILFETDQGKFIIEVKNFIKELNDKDFGQLINYIGTVDNCIYGILTNGNDYWIADISNAKAGLKEKLVYKLKISELKVYDIDVLKCFENPLDKLDDLPEIIIFNNRGIKLGKLETETIVEKYTITESKELNIIPSIQKNVIFEKPIEKKPTENYPNKKGIGDSDVLLEQIIPVVKSIKANGGDYYTKACKEIALKVNGIKHNSVMSQCTRGLGFNGKGSKDNFITSVKNGDIKKILLQKYPHRAKDIEREL